MLIYDRVRKMIFEVIYEILRVLKTLECGVTWEFSEKGGSIKGKGKTK